MRACVPCPTRRPIPSKTNRRRRDFRCRRALPLRESIGRFECDGSRAPAWRSGGCMRGAAARGPPRARRVADAGAPPRQLRVQQCFIARGAAAHQPRTRWRGFFGFFFSPGRASLSGGAAQYVGITRPSLCQAMRKPSAAAKGDWSAGRQGPNSVRFWGSVRKTSAAACVCHRPPSPLSSRAGSSCLPGTASAQTTPAGSGV